MDAKLIRELFDYDKDHGRLIWKARKPDSFAASSEAERKRICAIWNAKFSGKFAMSETNGNGYLRGSIFNKKVYLHRCVWAWHHGAWPVNVIDHVNGNRSDNRIENLRDVSRSQNCHNKPTPANNKSGFKGVSWDNGRKKWLAQIRVEGKNKTLGHYDNKEDARDAYVKASKRFVWGGENVHIY